MRLLQKIFSEKEGKSGGMKTKIIYKDFQINNVSFERVEFDDKEKYTRIYLDDVNEKRWVIKPIVEQALKITTSDCVYYKKGDLAKECFIKKENSFPLFQRHILEVEDSKWIKELKRVLKKVIHLQII